MYHQYHVHLAEVSKWNFEKIAMTSSLGHIITVVFDQVGAAHNKIVSAH